MALIPGTLPNDTCYGTPQDLLELFAQYLDVPAFALNSKVVFGTSSAGLTADVVWFDTGSGAPASATNPIMKITVSGGFVDYIKNYITSAATVTIVGADSVLILDASDSGNTKKGLVSDIVALAVPAAGSVTYPMLSGTSGTEANNVASRTAKAWVKFDGTTNVGGFCTIKDDFNVSTVADNGPGDYTINFSTAIGNVNYAIAGMAQPASAVPNGIGISSAASPSSTALTVVTWSGIGPGINDAKDVTVVVFAS